MFLLVCALSITGVIGNANITIASAAESKIIVEKGTASEEFDTIQEAIDSVQNQETATISVPAGTYDEAITIKNMKNTCNRTIILKGAQAGNTAVVNGNKRSASETILTNGIEISGLHEDASIIIDGFTLHNKGMNILGWSNLIDTTGDLKIINNIITDVENGSVSAIHVNTNAASEFVDTLEVSNNYIENIGESEFATNGVYATITMKTMNINDNVIRDVNHTCINFASAIVQSEANITGNVIANWNKDGIAGSGAGASQGDGIYITKTNTSNTTPIRINQNHFTRDETLEGSYGKAARCANKGMINLNENYWGTDSISDVIFGISYANVTLTVICDENMALKNQSILSFTLSTIDLYVSGKSKERKLSATVTMLDKTMEKPDVVYTTDTPDLIAIETRDDGVYYVAKKAGEAKVIATVIDPVSNEEHKIEKTLLVKDIELADQKMEPNETIQMTFRTIPKVENLSSFKKEWTSSDETIAVIDENGLVTSSEKEGITEILLTIKLGNTIYYQASATVTVGNPITNTAPLIHAEDQTLTVGETFDPLDHVTATDLEDGDVTNAITVIKNTVDMHHPGTYEVTYQVMDSEGLKAEKTITVTVKDIEKITITMTAIMNGTTEAIWSEDRYAKGYELDSDQFDAFNSIMKDMGASSVYQDFEWKGFYLDKEGKNALEIGHVFHEDTMIYVLGEPKQDLPEVPDQPNQPTMPDETLQPNVPSHVNTSTTIVKKEVLADTGSMQAHDVLFRLCWAVFAAFSISMAIIYILRKKKEINAYKA